MFQPQTFAPVVPPPIAAGEPIWVDLITPAPQAARDFYAALFGWEYQLWEEMGGYATAHRAGNKVAGISPPPPQGLKGSPGWRVSFASEDIHADAARIAALGGHTESGPMQIGNQGHMGQFSDPDGASFGLWQDDRHGGFAAYDGPGRLVWAEVNTRNAEGAVDFYASVLGATSTPMPQGTYHTLQHGGQSFAGVSGNAQNWNAVGAAGWMVYFYADDVDQTVQRAEQAGGKVLVPPFDMDFGRMAVLSDPAGAVFSVMNPRPAGA
ncbi:hypothetical protein GCM10010840_01130 [Deinococcus aerolatus]|uniref:VOC domain-containing protein n=1 Tax=Deinococcus aerolatus TaxID=522487 RepID=A0ABQ2FZ61_9DEIO|nr:VOC family protein [Deinococcus aerolatus]GGL66945.1 hypothetical protein GCM10010840_01130 [Deinococcus aerolatus]